MAIVGFIGLGIMGASMCARVIEGGFDTYVIDMTPFINIWWSGLSDNYGIIFKPGVENTSPNRCVLTFPDSLVIHYTLAPEVE